MIPKFIENREIPKSSNIIAQDPTRTTLIRQGFILDLQRRFRHLRKAIHLFLVENDVFGLKKKENPFLMNAVPHPRAYEFYSDPDKLKAFNEWFRQQVEEDILSPSTHTPAGEEWPIEYVDSAYKMGLRNAHNAVKREGFFQEEDADNFFAPDPLTRVMGSPETLSKIRLLGTRAFEQLKGITGPMGAELNRILAQGIADGTNISTIAREISERIDVSIERARKIARTEIIHAHAEGQLDAFEALGVDELGVKAEFSTAGDDKVCPKCAPLEGVKFTIAEARGLIPLHPNCRCSFIPSI